MVTCKFNKTFIQWRAQKFFLGGAVFLKKIENFVDNFFMSANLIFKLSEFLHFFLKKKTLKMTLLAVLKNI